MFRTLSILLLVIHASSAMAVTAPVTPTFLLSWGNHGSAPGQFDYPSGVAVDALGNVYVAEQGNHRIQKFDRLGNFLAQWGSPGSGNGQFNYPWGVTTDVAGNVYVADSGNQRIQKFTNTGTYLTQWGSPGTGDGQFQFPIDVATDAAGNVYVSDVDSHIKKFTNTGTYLTQWGSPGSGNGQFATPYGVATDAAGNVYVADRGNDRIQKFTGTGTYLTQWGPFGSGNTIWGVEIDAVGNVYVVEQTNHRIQKFTSTGTYLTQWGSLGSGDGQFSYPMGVATDAAGNVYVADFNHRIQKFSGAGAPLAEPAPTFLLKWGLSGGGAGEFMFPEGVATDGTGNVYVCDGTNRVQKFSSTGTYQTQWGSNLPGGVATDTPGDVYVSDRSNSRIQKFATNGTYLTQWGSSGSGNGQFNSAWGVATDGAGNVYVADQGNARIQKFTSTGAYLTQWGSFGTGNGQFNGPYGVATDAAGNVYVADRDNHRIQKFSSTGTYLTQWGSNGSGNGQFRWPYGVATDAACDVYVADTANNRIQKFTSTGTYLSQCGSFGTGSGQMNTPHGVATDAAGNVYVADFNQRVQKFVTPPEIALTSDVGNDQGRQVQIRFLRSSADAPGSGSLVTGYEIYRRNDPLPGPSLGATRDGGSLGPSAPSPSALSPANIELAGWTYLMTAPAHGESEYNVVVPTLVDATSASLEYSAFMVRAATTDPFTFYDSGVENGFSVDNLPPPSPTSFTAAFAAGTTRLHWGVSPAGDFASFKLYRGLSEDFMPGSDDLIAMTTDTTYADVGPAGSFYKLSAVDRNGNEGLYAMVGPGQTTDVPTEPAIALTFALQGSSPVPRGRMKMRFTLPTGEPARLELFDVRGRLVVVRDVGSMGAGRHAVELSAGYRLASGVYFVRLIQGANMMAVRQVVLN